MNLYYDGKSLKLNAETKYSESQIWLRLSNSASIEITHEQDGIPEEDYFFSFRLHCSDEEKDKYKETCGVITTSCFDELWEVQECLRFTLFIDERRCEALCIAMKERINMLQQIANK